LTVIRALILAVALLLPAAAQAQTRGAVRPASQQLATQAQAALSANQLNDAIDFFEASLAADPANLGAYVGLGRVYERQGLRGRAMKFYRQALTINPNDVPALEAQALGMVASGNLPRARANLDRLRRLCTGACTSTGRVDAAIAQAATKTSANTRTSARPQAQPVRR
jgi:tetratricopeptide (TPR) repeat protein